MKDLTKLTDRIFYVGVNDRTKHLFEGLWPLPLGVSYNAYLVCGERTALVDTVDACFTGRLLANVRERLGDRPLDYLVINHMEPDHSASIAAVRQAYPAVRIVGNAKTLQMIEGYYGIACGTVEVKEGDVLDLGGLTLAFCMIPMVHWPETMATWCAEERTIFSGDAFGTFGALNGDVTDEQLDVEPFWEEMRRYYACIVGKYGQPVQRALAKVAPLDIAMICSTHGPVWRREIARVVELYDKVSRYEGEPGAVIAYGSMYGNTEQMAETVARGRRAADRRLQSFDGRRVAGVARHLPLRYARRRFADLQRPALPAGRCAAAQDRRALHSAPPFRLLRLLYVGRCRRTSYDGVRRGDEMAGRRRARRVEAGVFDGCRTCLPHAGRCAGRRYETIKRRRCANSCFFRCCACCCRSLRRPRRRGRATG